MVESSGPNPFEAPSAAGPLRVPEPGVLDIGVALQDGWRACWASFPMWLGAMFVGMVVAVLGTVTIIGIILVLPVLLYGMMYFVIRAVDGEAEFGDIFAGFRKYGTALGGMLGLTGLQILISLPGQVLLQMGPLFDGDLIFVLLGIGYVVNMLWTFLIVVRFYYAPFFLIDQGLGVIDSFKASWEATSQQKLMSAVFVMVMGMILMLGVFACLVGIFPASMISYCAFASAYRQLSRRQSAL